MKRRWLGQWLGALTALGIACSAVRLARAEEKARLTYVRGAGTEHCPAEVELRLLVMARLGYDPFSPQASRVVLARVEQIEHGDLRGSVELIDEQGLWSGRRELAAQGGRCDELSRAMALSISLAIDPERATQPASVSAPPVAPSPPPAAPPPTSPGEPEPFARPARFFGALALTSTAGALPAVAFGGGAMFGVKLGPISLALEGRFLQSLSRELEPRGRLRGMLFGPALLACAQGDRLAFCAAGLVGSQRLSASELAEARTSSGLYVGVGPSVTLRAPFSRGFAARFGVEGLLDLSRNAATVSGVEVWKTPLLSGTLSAGVEAHFL